MFIDIPFPSNVGLLGSLIYTITISFPYDISFPSSHPMWDYWDITDFPIRYETLIWDYWGVTDSPHPISVLGCHRLPSPNHNLIPTSDGTIGVSPKLPPPNHNPIPTSDGTIGVSPKLPPPNHNPIPTSDVTIGVSPRLLRLGLTRIRWDYWAVILPQTPPVYVWCSRQPNITKRYETSR